MVIPVAENTLQDTEKSMLRGNNWGVRMVLERIRIPTTWQAPFINDDIEVIDVWKNGSPWAARTRNKQIIPVPSRP